MAHYAFIDENNIVADVIIGREEDEVVDGISDWEAYYSALREGMRCLRTSYNTFKGQHLDGRTPFRGNFASVGYEWREDLDAFIPPQVYGGWVLNEETFSWEAPVPIPAPVEGKVWVWNQVSSDWQLIDIPGSAAE
jgi:hypothetical protein